MNEKTLKRAPVQVFPFTDVACDGGVLIELLEGGPQSLLAQEILAGRVEPLTTILALTETQYILCRKIGPAKANQKMKDLIDSNYYEIWQLDSLRNDASLLKCQRSLSLPDCFTIALAMKNSIPAIFATREKELDRELHKQPFSISIYFLDEVDLNKVASS